ncbi:Helicase conserved C-terminal domain-containing protein [Lachnospiraceae bacterium YSD2013]|nr:Helicase conserved C-terminal domain-containing protein [Lachnospiraceae bacterium YSD2013]
MTNYDELRAGFETAYIDGTVASSVAYRPQFVSNNYKEGKKVLSAIEDELLKCDQFQISVAFITLGGITPLLQTLQELEAKHIPGEILTTNYLSFSEPRALKKLNELSNITLKMYDVDAADEGFHTKGYIFKKDETYRIIVGSSNITSTALTSNREWNTKIISTDKGEMAKEIVAEFKELWTSPYALHFDKFYEQYVTRYNIIKHQRQVAKLDDITSFEKYDLKPNIMQSGFITNLKKILAEGASRALLISATGTGKTYASAFAMRELGFKRVLFLVHRGQLAIQTEKAYKMVFSNNFSMGLVGAGHNQYDADFIFATVQTLNRDEHLLEFDKDHFDCIVLDEAHHVPAATYQKIMNHFTPKLWLGMTATPDKRDDNIEGRNVYEIFNHQIAYEIRLQQAMEESLLCPFHYFGITDLSLIDDKVEDLNFSVLTSDERVRHIVSQANYYGYSGEKVKGLIFCRSIKETEELSAKFNKTINPETGKLFRTIALNGSASEQERQEAFERLAMNEDEASFDKQPLDYIFSKEILNEGVDIVEVNQVIMLRPTESPIVFIQQLGRGLRKAVGKEYVVVLDFIGNYEKNFMIPIALSGDRSYNKDTIRRYLMEGGRVIPGASTVHFDEISRGRIYESIDRMATTKKMLTEKYNILKDRLGCIPTILDFYENGEIDPMLFVEYSGSYDKFVRLVDKEYKITFSDKEERILEYVSNVIMNGKRIHELLMLRLLLDNGEFSKNEFREALENNGEKYRESDYVSSYRIITKEFLNSDADRKRYYDVEFINKGDVSEKLLTRTLSFYDKLKNALFQKELQTLIEYGLCRYKDMYKNHDDNNLVLYQKYSRKDVCRILNWDKDCSSTVYGYRIKHGTCPIFVTYEKEDDISDTTKYPDEFERISSNPEEFSSKIFSWMTRSRVTLSSPEAQQLIHAKESGLKVLLFLKKSDGEGTDFYYMGEVDPIKWAQTTISDENKNEIPIVNFKLELRNEARKDIFDYFTA